MTSLATEPTLTRLSLVVLRSASKKARRGLLSFCSSHGRGLALKESELYKTLHIVRGSDDKSNDE